MKFLKDKENSISAKMGFEPKMADPNIHTPGMMDGEMVFDGDAKEDLIFYNQ